MLKKSELVEAQAQELQEIEKNIYQILDLLSQAHDISVCMDMEVLLEESSYSQICIARSLLDQAKHTFLLGLEAI